MVRHLRIRPSNSTVNGYDAAPNRDACKYFDGWKNLSFTDRRVFVDGKERIMRSKYGLFGLGKVKGFSCGEYLHVPLRGREADGRWYRVRCRFEPGMLYKGQRVESVRARKKNGHWYWLIKFGR